MKAPMVEHNQIKIGGAGEGIPVCTADEFLALSKEWEPLVRAGKKKAKSIMTTAKTSMTLTQEQEFQIDAWEKEGS